MSEIKNLPPFKHLCMTIGEIPSEHIESMTYLELLEWFIHYLKDNVVPTVNNNSKVVKELQNYVNHYFDNLKVQNEINNKLDSMSTDGTLQNIVNNYLNPKKSIIIIGDSYSKHNFLDITKFWWEYFRESLNLTLNENLFVKASDGAGFYNGMFKSCLVSITNSIPDEKIPYITDILVVGGYNDRDHPGNELYEKMKEFNTFAKENIPNAQISLAFVSLQNPYITQEAVVNSIRLPRIRKQYAIGANNNGWKYLLNTEYILHNYNIEYWQEDGVHPSQLGQTELGNMMTSAFLTGCCNVVKDYGSTYLQITPSGIAKSYSNKNFTSGINNNFAYVKKSSSNNYIIVDETQPLSLTGNSTYEIGTLMSNYVCGFGSGCSEIVMCWFSGKLTEDGNTIRIPVECLFYFNLGKLFITPLSYYNNTAPNSMIVTHIFFMNFNILDLTEQC